MTLCDRRVGGAKQTLVRSTAAMYLLQIAKYVFPFITLPYLARVLGTDGYAVRSYVLSIMTFVTMVAEFGFMNYGIAKLVEGGLEPKNTSEVTSSIMVGRLVLFIPLTAVVSVMNMTVPLMFENQAYVWLAFVAALLSSLLPDFVFRAYEEMGVITLRYVVSKGVAVLLTFLLVRSPEDLLLVPALDVVTSLIALAWSWVAATRKFKIRIARVSFVRVRGDLIQSSVYFVSGLSTIVFSSLTTFLLGVLNGSTEEIAYWGVAMTVMNGLAALYSPLSQSLYPYYLKKAKGNGKLSLRKLYLYCLVPLLAGALVLAALHDPVMWVLGGEAYLPGSYVILLLSPMVVVSFYVQLSGWPSLGAVGRVAELTRTTTISMVFHLFELLLLAIFTHYELAYVAIARLLSELVLAILRVVECRRADII